MTVGKSHELLMRVLESGVTLYLDGNVVSEFKGDFSRLDLPPLVKLRHGQSLGIHSSGWLNFSSITIDEFKGQGRFLRDKAAGPN